MPGEPLVQASSESLRALAEIRAQRAGLEARKLASLDVFSLIGYEPNCAPRFAVRRHAAGLLGITNAFDARVTEAVQDDLPPPCGQCPQELFHAATEDAVLFGGAAGGGKSIALVAEGIKWCARYPGLRVLLVRRSYDELAESILPALRKFDFARSLGGRWNGVKFELRFSQGSYFTLRYLETLDDASRRQGGSVQLLLVDEYGLMVPGVIDFLRYERLRSDGSVPVVGMRATSNPGGASHGEVKALFVEPTQYGRRVYHDHNGASIRFIPSRAVDNFHIDPGYLGRLDAIPDPNRRAAMRDGDWDTFAGAIFPELSQERHVLEPMSLPASWDRFAGVDWGFAKPWAVLHGAVDEDGRLWIYREIYQTQTGEAAQAEMILAAEDGEAVIARYADDAMWATRGDAKPIAEVYGENGVHLTPAGKGPGSRVQGWQRIHSYLAEMPACPHHRSLGWDTCPRLHLFSTVRNLYTELKNLPYATTGSNIEDADPKASDHAADALRYLTLNLGGGPQFFDSPAPPGPKAPVEILTPLGQWAVREDPNNPSRPDPEKPPPGTTQTWQEALAAMSSLPSAEEVAVPPSGLLPWRREKEPVYERATTPPAADIIPNRSGFIQGVPPQGVDETDLTQGAATNTDRGSFLQELWEAYIKCPWSWACVNAISRTVTAGGLVMKWDSDTGEGDQKQPAKPANVLALERLISFTNPKQDIRQLARNIVADLKVFGDAFVEVVWAGKIPVALYNQDCPTTFPKTDEHGVVSKYIQVTEYGQRVEFEPHQIIHISEDSARPGVLGISATHAAEESIVAWMFLHSCEKEAARRGLPPNVHADLPVGMSEGDIKKWQDQYAARNVGPSNVGTPITTKGGGKVAELQTAKLPDILAAKREARGEIISSYGVPPAKVGIIESGNLGGGTGSDQNKTFWLDIINPTAQLIAEKLQFFLAVQAFGIKGWHIEFAGVDYRDDKTIADIMSQYLRDGAWTLNRYRAEIGEPPIPGGDDAVLIARQDIVLWADMAARSAAAVAMMAAGGSGEEPAGLGGPGPPPATGTEPSKGQGGRDNEPSSESIAAIAAAVVRELRAEWRTPVAEHTQKLTARQRVWNRLSRNFPAADLGWVTDSTTEWDGPLSVPADHIDINDEHQWDGVTDRAKVARIKKRYRRTGKMKPAVLVRAPGSGKDAVIDGHHHILAAAKLGHPATAYVAHVASATGTWQVLANRQHRKAA